MFLNLNDVEFDLSIGHALVHFAYFLNNKEKMYGGPRPPPPKFIYIDVFWT